MNVKCKEDRYRSESMMFVARFRRSEARSQSQLQLRRNVKPRKVQSGVSLETGKRDG
jgi:hypothetical protein